MQSCSALLCLVFVALAHSAFAAEPAETIRPITDADSILAIYTQGLGLASNGRSPQRLVFAAWPDGRVIWSEDQIQGGSPYRTATIHPAQLEKALVTINRDGFFGDPALAQPKFGPDAQTTVIYARTKRGELKMQSWHELYELDGKVVATDAGLTPLVGHSRPDILRGATLEYLYYRVAWADIRHLASALMPAESKPTKGHLDIREGKAIWIDQ